MEQHLFLSQKAPHPLYRHHPKQPLPSPYAKTESKVITGTFGTILYQELTGYYTTFRHYHCFIKQAARVPNFQMEDRPFICVNMRNTVALQLGNTMTHTFYEWGSNMLYHPAKTGSIIFMKEGEYSFFTIHIQAAFLQQFLQNYPAGEWMVEAASCRRPSVLSPCNFPANSPMRSAISDILYYSYSDEYYLVYLAAKCQELLLPFLRQCQTAGAHVSAVSETEAESIYRVRERLLANLQVTPMLEELAQLAHLSEYKLKTGFKQIYGKGLFDFLHEARMRRAHELVTETLLPYDIIAASVGYQSNTTFLNQFKKYAGISPKRLRDSIQGKGARCVVKKK